MLEKAIIINTVTEDQIQVQCNSEEYIVARTTNYAETGIPGLSAPITQFVNGNAQTLEMELLVDTYEEHRSGSKIINEAGEDVRHLTDQIIGLMDINPEIHAPPPLIFSWGENFAFTCVLARASQRFIMFRPDGTPVRARLQVTFNQFKNVDLEAKEIKRETADFSKRYVVGQGETLSSIAFRTYGNPALWRPIALVNEIDDPRSLPMGLELAVPQLPFLDPESGQIYQ
ncbi:MAG: CIS tube protein [Gammaproteobacteria bacterium]